MRGTALTRRTTHPSDADRAAIRVARSLDAEAERLVRSVPALSTLADQIQRAARCTTRGPLQHRLRRLAREYAGQYPCVKRAATLHAEADRLYWSVVVVHLDMIERHARKWAALDLTDHDDPTGWLTLYWYEAALRYDPEASVSYSRWATVCECANLSVGGRPDALYGPVRSSPFDREPAVQQEPLSTVPDEGHDPEPDWITDLDTRALTLAVQRVMGRVLNERERYILDRRYGNEDATLSGMGRTLGRSSERVRQIEVLALAKVREAMTQPSPPVRHAP